MSRLAGWRPSLRMAWRDVRRSRGRSVLVLVMIALPVLGVTAADVLIQTQDVSGTEALDRRLGSAAARVDVSRWAKDVVQGVDPDDGMMAGGRLRGPLPDLDAVRQALGRDVRGIRWITNGYGQVATDGGAAEVELAVLDLRDPLADGIFRVEDGRPAEAADEVVVNRDLAGRGLGIGDPLELDGGRTYEIVGIGESTSYRDRPNVVGLDPSLVPSEQRTQRTWLIETAPVTWDDVRALNAAHFRVLSREVVEHPPPSSEIPAQVQDMDQGPDDALVAVAVLVVVMALIEVVLLAGPAFAVGARRQARALALVAACGGTPAQARRVVLATGVVLGTLGAVIGVALGLVTAWALQPVFQRYSGSWFGPYDVPWLHLLGIAAFGLLSAFLAALVPAWLASRQDVVAVLAGRRGDRRPSLRSPVLGVVLFGVGVTGAAFGAAGVDSGEILIAASAIPSVLGMVLLVPVVVAALAAVSRRLPLPLRYAVRDAARHRTRTVPAVAAVAATVAGVVALGIANASDAEQSRASYQPLLPMGAGSVQAWGKGDSQLPALRAVVDDVLPEATTTELRGLPQELPGGGWLETSFALPGDPTLLDSYGGAVGSSVLVGEEGLGPVEPALTEPDRALAAEALAAGRAVVLTSGRRGAHEVKFRAVARGPGRERATRATVPAELLPVVGSTAPVQAVLPESLAAKLVHEPVTVGVLVEGSITEGQERDVKEAIAAVTSEASFYVERGFQNQDETVILLLVLGGLGGLLVLGGTLTATFLSLSDARPDLATLSAVGAAPRTRRAVAASYAMVVGVVGAGLGALVGAIPGVAISYPLTSDRWTEIDASGAAMPDHFLDVPWLLVAALVLGLPLLTAAVVGLTARSRLPMVARVD